MITYWELELWERRLFGHTIVDGRYPDGGHYHVTVDGFGRHKLKFEGKDWFDTTSLDEERRAWHLKVHVAGRRKPVVVRVYPQ